MILIQQSQISQTMDSNTSNSSQPLLVRAERYVTISHWSRSVTVTVTLRWPIAKFSAQPNTSFPPLWHRPQPTVFFYFRVNLFFFHWSLNGMFCLPVSYLRIWLIGVCYTNTHTHTQHWNTFYVDQKNVQRYRENSGEIRQWIRIHLSSKLIWSNL